MLLGIGAFAGVKLAKESQPVEVKAATSMKTFFLDCTGVSNWDDQSICIGTWDGSVNTYTEATKLADNYWTVTIDITGLSGVEFYRCKAGDPENNHWNKSSWNDNPSGNNFCYLTGFDVSSTWSSVQAADETYELASTTPSTSTKRIWVDPKDDFYTANARAALRVFNGGSHYKTYILGGSSQFVNVTHEGNTQYLFYVDIPVSYDCQLVRLHNVFNFVWTYSGNFSDITGYDTTRIVFSWDAAASLSAGELDDANNYTVEYAQRILDGYSTCLDSSVNGYGAYSNINSHILSKLDSSETTSLRSSTFNAPRYGTRTYGDKIDLMARFNNSGSSLINISSIASGQSVSIIVIVVISAVCVAAVGGYFLFRKKKEN